MFVGAAVAAPSGAAQTHSRAKAIAVQPELDAEAHSERRVSRGLGPGTGCLARSFGLVEPGAPPNRPTTSRCTEAIEFLSAFLVSMFTVVDCYHLQTVSRFVWQERPDDSSEEGKRIRPSPTRFPSSGGRSVTPRRAAANSLQSQAQRRWPANSRDREPSRRRKHPQPVDDGLRSSSPGPAPASTP